MPTNGTFPNEISIVQNQYVFKTHCNLCNTIQYNAQIQSNIQTAMQIRMDKAELWSPVLWLPVCGRLWLSMTQMVSAHRPQTQGEPSLWSVHNLFLSRSFPLCPFLFEPSLAHVNHASHMQQTPDWGGKKMQWPSGHFFFYTYTKTTKVEMDEDI